MMSYESTEIMLFRNFYFKRRAWEGETSVNLLNFLYKSSATEFMEWDMVLSSYAKEMATETDCDRNKNGRT